MAWTKFLYISGHLKAGGGTGGDEPHQVVVPWLSRVTFQSLLSQALHQQRDHSMVAGDEGGDGGRWRGGDREGRRGGKGGGGGRGGGGGGGGGGGEKMGRGGDEEEEEEEEEGGESHACLCVRPFGPSQEEKQEGLRA